MFVSRRRRSWIINAKRSANRSTQGCQVYRGVTPFLIADAVRIALLFAFPPLSLWLVGVLVP